jgi:hypothetical protein
MDDIAEAIIATNDPYKEWFAKQGSLQLKKKTQTPRPKDGGKYDGFNTEEIARYFDADGNPTDKLSEASHYQLVILADNPYAPMPLRSAASQIIARRNAATGSKQPTAPTAEEIEDRKLQQYLEARLETYPFTWKYNDDPVFFDQEKRHWMRKGRNGGWVPCTAFGLDPHIQQKGQRHKVFYAGPLAGYHEGHWAVSRCVNVLVTEEKDPIISINPEYGDAEKTWQFLLRALGKEQLSVFEEWLVRAADPDCLWDHILVLVGDPATGQLIQKIITNVVGGRSMNAERWLKNPRHNTNEIGYEHLKYIGPITSRMAKTMRYEFKNQRRTVKTPIPFDIDLWQRLTIVCEDEKSLKYLVNNRDKYLVLKLSPIESDQYPDSDLIQDEQDYLLYELQQRPTTALRAYWYAQERDAKQREAQALEELVLRLPKGWKDTAKELGKAIGKDVDAKVFGKKLTPLVAKRILKKHTLHGDVLYERVDQNKV